MGENVEPHPRAPQGHRERQERQARLGGGL